MMTSTYLRDISHMREMVIGLLLFISPSILGAQSPSSIAGRTLDMTVLSGSPPFPSNGRLRVLASAVDNSYGIVPLSDNIGPSTGTHIYTKTSDSTARISLVDDGLGGLIADLSFVTMNSGTYTVSSSEFPGANMSGTFGLYAGLSPESIAGSMITVTITCGFGYYRFLPAATGNIYNIVALSDNLTDSSGTYSYTKNSDYTGIIAVEDDVFGQFITFQLNYDSETGGTVFVREFDGIDYQTGIFTTEDVNPAHFWFDVNNGVATIKGYDGPGGNVVIPSRLGGVPVTSLAEFSFNWADTIQSLIIPNSVTNVGAYAFNDCRAMTNIYIGAGVASIGEYAFQGCRALTGIQVDPANPFYSGRDGVLLDKAQTRLIICPPGKTGEYIVPNSVLTIGELAFDRCTSLTNIVLGSKLVTIEDRAFDYCTNLTEIIIPDSVVAIGHGAFNQCSGLTRVVIGAGVVSLDAGFWDSPNIVHVEWNRDPSTPNWFFVNGGRDITSVIIGDKVTEIGPSAFADYTGLKYLVLGTGLVSIGGGAFQGCEQLEGNLIIPDSVQIIGSSAFWECTGLTNVVFGSGLDHIGHSAFAGCVNLREVVIPDNVTFVGSGAFDGCTGLNRVVIGSGVTNSIGYTFTGCPNIKEVEWGLDMPFFGATSVASVFPDSYSQIESFIIGDTVSTIGSWMFEGCTGLTNVVIGSGVTRIGHDAFRGCSSLTEIIIPDSVETIGHSAFSECTRLVRVVIGSGFRRFDGYAFAFCTALKSVYFKGVPISAGYNTFDDSYPTIYYRYAFKDSWGPTFAGRPTAIWPEAGSMISNNEGIAFSVYASDGQQVQIQARCCLVSGDWQTIATPTATSDNRIEFRDPDQDQFPGRFYRMVL